MVTIDIYDRILKLERFRGDLEKYRRTKMLEGILSNNSQIVPMPTKYLSGYIKDPYHQFRGRHNPNLEELSEIIELIDRGCIALVNYHEKTKVISFDNGNVKIEYFSQGIPVEIRDIGGPYR